MRSIGGVFKSLLFKDENMEDYKVYRVTAQISGKVGCYDCPFMKESG
jgi:hypothetical protein